MTAASGTGSQRNSPAPLQLWYAYPADLADAAVEQACSALLNDAERHRAARFHFDRHRREYLASHALARNALSHAYPLPPREWSFSVNAYGKPAPIPGPSRTGIGPWDGIPECGLGFNQSHSLELVVCLIAPAAAFGVTLSAQPGPDMNVGAHAKAGPEAGTEAGPEIGVDVEAFSRAPEIVPLAPRVFSQAEQAQLNALPAAERPQRALSLWTLKEAYIKARGMGLSLPLHGISFLFAGSGEIHLETEAEVETNPARWHFCLLDHSQHRVAMAVDEAIGEPQPGTAAAPFRPPLEIFAARPPFAAPARLPSGSETWFPASRKAG